MTQDNPPTPERPADDIHVPFLVAALLFGVLGGFSLAFSLPVEALLGSLDISWVSHAQVHGHLQVIGFAGLFVIGVSLRLVPRFGGRRAMSFPGAERWVLILLVGGLLARALGQPLAEYGGGRVAVIVGAAAEATGAAVYLAMVAATLLDALRKRQGHAILLTGAATGLLVQALLGLWWLSEMARDGGTVLSTRENSVLLQMQFFGFLLPAILGVGMRTFPTFFGRKPPGDVGSVVVATLALGGIALWSIGGAGMALEGEMPWQWSVAGQALTGAGILSAIVAFGPWRPATRLAAASKSLRWAIHPALLWLALTGLLLIGTAAQAAFDGRAVSTTTLDAVRHTFALGVVTLAIIGMAQLILPEFASERLVRPPGSWRGPTFGAVLSLAAALRGLAPLVGIEGDARWWAMSIAGGIAWLAVGAFAWLVWSASRSHRAYVQRISKFRRNELPVADA